MLRSARAYFYTSLFSLIANAASAAPLVPVPGAIWDPPNVSFIQVGSALTALNGSVVPGTTSLPGAAQIQVVLSPLPALTAIASGDGSIAQASLLYYGIVDTPSGTIVPTTVNIVATGSLFSMADTTPSNGSVGGSNSQARLTVGLAGAAPVINAESDQGNNNGAIGFSGVVPVRTNEPFYVQLFVRSWAFETGTSATTFLDPFFFLDSIQIGEGYSLRFSDGVGNIASSNEVPLPGALPLFATGVGALGLLGWRRKRKVAAA